MLTFAGADSAPVTAPDFEFDFPKIPELQPFFQAYQKELTDEMTTEFSRAQAEGEVMNPWSLDASAEVTFKGSFWSVFIGGYDYRGGAHGIPLLEVVFFDAETFEKIPQSEVLVEGAYQTLSRLSREGLVKQGFDPADSWMLEGTDPDKDNFRLVVPTTNGVKVIFGSYQVASYAQGTPTVELDWTVARSLFRKSYRPPVKEKKP